jgi:hypothetical protein
MPHDDSVHDEEEAVHEMSLLALSSSQYWHGRVQPVGYIDVREEALHRLVSL